jgi:HSP20 family protein
MMSVRDLIPWGRPQSPAPSRYREQERSPLLGLRREMDRLFDEFFEPPFAGLAGGRAVWPQIEVKEGDDALRITAELPGLTEKDVELLVEDGMLTIRGEQKNEHEEAGYSERFYGRFERRIALPPGVDEAKCEADFRDGLLKVTLPRTAEAQRGRRIPINAQTRH